MGSLKNPRTVISSRMVPNIIYTCTWPKEILLPERHFGKSNHDFCVGREDTSLALEQISNATSPRPERLCCGSKDPMREEGLAQGWGMPRGASPAALRPLNSSSAIFPVH